MGNYGRMRSLLGRRRAVAAAAAVPTPQFYWKFNFDCAPAIGGVYFMGSEGYDLGKFDQGLSDAVDVSTATPVLTGDFNGEYAVAYWTNRPGASGEMTLRQTGAAGVGGNEFRIRLFNSAGLSRFQYNIGAYQSIVSASGIANDGLPHHIAIVVSGGVVTRYDDGVPGVLGIDVTAEVGSFDPAGTMQITASGSGLADDLAVWVGLGNLPSAADIATIAAAAGDLSTLIA